MARPSNRNNYPLGELTRRYDDEQNGIRARRLAFEQELVELRAELTVRTDEEIVRAVNSGVSKREIARRLDISPNTFYARWARIQERNGGRFAAITAPPEYPHSEWFASLVEPDYFQITLPQNWTPYGMTSSYPKGTTFEGRYALHVRSGRHTFRDFRELKTISAGAASGIANDPKVLAKFQEWASVAVPDLDTADVEKATDNPPETLPHGKRATTLDDLYTD